MKPYRGSLLAAAVLLATLPLTGCDNPLEGGSDPSGSYIRVTNIAVDPTFVDIWSNDGCAATVSLVNESAPNAEEPTNSNVTLQRFQVKLEPLNLVGDPILLDGWQTLELPADGTVDITVSMLGSSTMELIRSAYPTVGHGDTLWLRATISIWGEDAFKVTVQATGQTTFQVGAAPTASAKKIPLVAG